VDDVFKRLLTNGTGVCPFVPIQSALITPAYLVSAMNDGNARWLLSTDVTIWIVLERGSHCLFVGSQTVMFSELAMVIAAVDVAINAFFTKHGGIAQVALVFTILLWSNIDQFNIVFADRWHSSVRIHDAR
jgi:hypothetical protein